MQPVDQVAKFADIAGPAVVEQSAACILGEAERGNPERRRCLVAEMLGEQHDVPAAFPQRRNTDQDRADAVVEIPAEAAVRGFPPEIAVGRANHTQVERPLPVVADAPDAAFLQGAQQEGLDIKRHLADFVEAQHPAIGALQNARLAVARGAGEGAAGMAEQLAAEKLARDRPAIEGDEGRARAGAAAFVDEPRDEFLAHAGFPLNEEGRDIR